MVDEKLENKKNGQEYAFDYNSAITKEYHGGRTAEKQAGWFLPYLKSGMALLDCGCGPGSITVGLAKAVDPGRVIGVDISADTLKLAEERAASARISNIQFEIGDICRLNFPDNSFDAVFSHNAIEHIPEPDKALKEMRRVLKPGGVIGIRDVDHGGQLIAPVSELMGKLMPIWDSHLASLGGCGQLGRHLGKLLFEAGFTEVKVSASYDVYNDPEGRRIVAASAIGHLNEETVAKHAISSGLASLEELEAIKKELQNWQDIPGAFLADAHCEAIGRKA